MEYPKRLIEVDLPIKRISEHARREKSIRHGHISSLHIWWARRPLAACRAVICASLWPDPADPLCPESFRKTARTLMLEWAEKYTRLLTSQESLRRFVQIQKNPDKLSDDIFLRQALLDFIADFANWDNSTVKEYLYTSRTLTQSAHESLCGIVGTRPLVVDPFAGGGAIPIEALRVGADAFASDLNPVAVILNKVLLEYIPKYGQKLADEISKWGPYIKEQAEKELKEFYPKDSDGATPIAYIWARTIISEAPSAEKISIEVPLIGNMWLAKGAGDKCALRYKRDANNKIMKDVHEVNWVDGSKHIVYRPRFELFCPTTSSQVEQGPLRRSSVTCPISGYTTSSERVRKQFKNRRGGADDARLIAVVTKQKSGRGYRLSTKYDEEIIEKARKELKRRLINCDTPFSLIPQEELPYLRSIFNVRLLDVTSWGDLFSARQLLSLSVFAKHIRSLDKLLTQKYDKEFACAIQTCLALIFDKQADLCTSFSKWDPVAQCPRLMFVRHAIGILWDYAESCPLGDSSGSWNVIYNGFLKALESIGSDWQIGKVEMVNAENHPLPNDSTKLFFTDPPYYDAIPYADLSDFFYVWMKRILYSQYPDYFGEELTPKREEIVQLAERNPKYAYKTHENFEKKMRIAMAEGRRILAPDGIGVVVFAQKSTAGWEAMLKSMIEAGWQITASWPLDTELSYRVRAQGAAALGSSIHLVCRPRENPDGSVRMDDVGDWRDVLVELPKRIHEWMPRLAEEGVVGADAIFACLGPALEIFSRYSDVEKASGEKVTLKEYLEQVWAVVAKEALNMIFEGADTSGFEEDARLTAMWLWTLSTGAANGDESASNDEADNEDEEETSKAKLSGYTLEYDTARKIAQGLGANLEHLQNLVEVKGDKARLLPVSQRTKALFGKDESESPVAGRKKKSSQLELGFMEEVEKAEQEGSWGQKNVPHLGNTMLDRIHQSMILFAANRSEALKRFLVEEGVGRDQKFWKLAQALSALYPSNSDEKRWVDGVLARKKGLGF